MMKSLRSLFCFLVIWQLGAGTGILANTVFSSPYEIMLNVWERSHHLVIHTGFTLWRLFLGILLASITAIPTAFVISRSKKLGDYLRPLLASFYPIPKIVIYPFLMMMVGTGDVSKVLLIAIGAFFLIFTQMLSGLDRILNSSLMEVVRVYGITGPRLYIVVLLKGVRVDILTGLNLAIGYGLVMAVAGEMSAAQNGIGFFIWNAWDSYQIVDMYSGLFIISFLGFLTHFGIEKVKGKYLKRSIL